MWFEAYLWGIETIINNPIIIHLYKHLKPTYEGLKLTIPCTHKIWSVNLKPTYEGLKPTRRVNTSSPVGNLKPTYEGLKHPQSTARKARFHHIWSLPMRDWNSTPQVYTVLRHFHLKPTYEGLKPHTWVVTSPLAPIWSLPMRDWNCQGYRIYIYDKCDLKPTYEGLKQVFRCRRITGRVH